MRSAFPSRFPSELRLPGLLHLVPALLFSIDGVEQIGAVAAQVAVMGICRLGDPFVDVEQAAREYNVSERTLYRALKDGRLARFKGGLGDRKVYVDRLEVKRLLKPRKVKG